tara:strand:+ start:4588 stop:5835 length:1248 start_codon:yes stop_codon:yes gene_type:complete
MSNFLRSTAEYDSVPNPYDVPVSIIDLSDHRIPNSGLQLEYYKRIRQEDPVHYLEHSKFGPYWSVTTYKDLQEVENHPEIYSSDVRNGGCLILDGMPLGFMSMDDPLHCQQRGTLMPLMVPSNLARMGDAVRERTKEILQNLPRGEAFDWVEAVSLPLTTRMLSIILDFPYDEEKILPVWTEWSTDVDAGADPKWSKRRNEILEDMGVRLRKLFEAKKTQEPTGDVLSIMAHSEHLSNLSQKEFQGLMSLIVVGGNDTTRNSMTALIQAMEEFPSEFDKVRENPKLVSSAIQETIRWWSPVAHQRRTVTQDTELSGKKLKKGDKVILWFKSGNYDEEAFPNPGEFNITRDNVRRHIAFGFGIHRCFGARLGELQVSILLEEILKMGLTIKTVSPAVRSDTCMINGFEQQLVIVED